MKSAVKIIPKDLQLHVDTTLPSAILKKYFTMNAYLFYKYMSYASRVTFKRNFSFGGKFAFEYYVTFPSSVNKKGNSGD